MNLSKILRLFSLLNTQIKSSIKTMSILSIIMVNSKIYPKYIRYTKDIIIRD